MNEKDLLPYIEKLVIVQRVSKAGNPYERAEIVFKGGYVVPVFLDSDQMYIVKNIVARD